ncbi:hypothetical protein FOZ62_000830 [Perkinsus olseni]|uniref:Uncharacterized protein n=1 Tax=Perkinsus olseni TaxID=32597 RepID=A0A7J6TGY3_PEROL|nr:hypothetical protein FOZ62_000830 [Perkinsus olseni]
MSCRSTDEEVSRASADGEFDDTTPSPTLDDEITFHRDNAVRFLKDLKAYTADDDDGASAYLEDLVESISYLEACQSRKGGELTRPELPTKSLDSHTTRGASPQPDYDSECTSTLTRQFTGRGHSRRGEPNEDRWKYYHPHNVRVDVTSSGMMDSVKANDEGFADGIASTSPRSRCSCQNGPWYHNTLTTRLIMNRAPRRYTRPALTLTEDALGS